ncbi:hypothetical protein FV242_05725 [Methylobacterium sp. WL64]|uniref:hypothetical protein n=1 Tax=Methylobacterium sp. WL64 TaxID=2603894 RepID=UPI0011CA784F|nr:hypothetical protein [Methylobacterium sp. WL64]TXN04853.1 hypothetical protein FV242_05725 [Methylobacterium sp. WL64]
MTRPAPSAALLDQLARRFRDAPRADAGGVVSRDDALSVRVFVGDCLQTSGDAVGNALGRGGDERAVGHGHDSRAVPAPAQALPRGGHTELALERLVEQDARIRGGGGLPACGSFFS